MGHDVLNYDVVCVGAGGAGVTVSVWAAKQGLSVALVSKEPAGYGNTRMSGGSIVYPGVSEGDDEETFYNDLLNGGDQLNQEEMARIMASEGSRGALILEELGHALLRDEEGSVSARILSKWGGHSRARTVSSPGKMGGLIGQVLRGALARSSVDLFEETICCQVVLQERKAQGVICLDLVGGKAFAISTRAVVLATGGLGWMFFPQTSNFRTICGDGFALAFDAGAELIDMEMIQFLPFSFTHPPSIQGIGVGDPMAAGPYGKLLNRDGEVVLENINVMTRAQVSKAIALEISRGKGTRHGGLTLDLRGNLGKEEGIKAREPWVSMGLFDPVKEVHGIEAFRWEKPWDVAPTAHFMIGGVKTDGKGQSSVKGLFAAGELVGGLHGANRLGSVALGEIFLFSRRTADEVVRFCQERQAPRIDEDDLEKLTGQVLRNFGRKGGIRPIAVKRAIQGLMRDSVGPVREKQGIESTLAQLDKIEEMLEDLKIASFREYNLEVLDAIEAQFMLKIARVIMSCALIREESRGAHTRLDFPERDDGNWLGNIVLRREGDRVTWRFMAKEE
jgi:succinate dehydrogenase/fumarate reductase flavoprotein subunit